MHNFNSIIYLLPIIDSRRSVLRNTFEWQIYAEKKRWRWSWLSSRWEPTALMLKRELQLSADPFWAEQKSTNSALQRLNAVQPVAEIQKQGLTDSLMTPTAREIKGQRKSSFNRFCGEKTAQIFFILLPVIIANVSINPLKPASVQPDLGACSHSALFVYFISS